MVTGEVPGPVLFCSALVWERYRTDLLRVAPALDPVLLSLGRRVPVDDVGRIEIGFLSADLWPAQSANFMKVATSAPRIRWFHTASAGVDHPVFRTFLERGVRLTTSSGASATPIAHTVMMYLLAMSRNLADFIARQRDRVWADRHIEDLEGRTVGVVGMGPIGSEVARLAAEFGMRAIGMRRTPTGKEPCETWTFARLPEMLAVVDDLVLALPLTTATKGLIGADELGLMKTGSRVVNIGRGELLDELALIAALRSGHIGAAALDVFAVEPLPTDSPLWSMPNVIVTPHASGATPLSERRAVERFVDNLERYVRNKPLTNEVTW